MDALTIASERARARRRIVVLDDNGRILLAQAGSLVDDRVFGFNAKAKRLPADLEEPVRLAIAKHGHASREVITDYLNERNMALRIFPLKRGDRTHVGLILEIVRTRVTDG